MLRFTASIEIIGINPYVLVTRSQAEQLEPGWRKPLPVLVRVNGQPTKPWRINMMPKGDGNFYLYLHGDIRKASGTKVGDTVHIELEFDAQYRGGPVALPDWFQAALAANPSAKTNWQALTPSRQKEIARYLSSLKSKEAQQRNLAKALHILSGQPGRFMARNWNDGK